MAVKKLPVEAARHYAPRGIAVLIAPILRPALRARGVSLATLIEDWPAIAGSDIAARSLPVKCAAGTLTLGCTGPDALELQHTAPALIARINLALGGGTVARLRFIDLPRSVVDRPVSLRRLDRQRDDMILPPLTGAATLPEGPVGVALARLRQGLHRHNRAGQD
ncbi:DciA family protein [Acidiphilium sp.]|uniref:DciA family protein n=1 Tax=Acidiphilium sp. TaxID=527 RepID=UPI003D07EDA8